ncbi:zinc ribbon domain-containing protein [Psychrobacillus sp. FJAT-51614]|uniref:Zinc ribbon domain-containing protein n=1 Tax=Psychrobacillus mangrovi TaxID=3117745 RepID=A0ABU8F444_9BACI
MNEIQNKIGGGLNKIQDSLQQGKQKIQVAQEVSQIQQNINSLRQKRQVLILQIGNITHKKLRLNLISDEDLKDIALNIEQIDKEIYIQASNMKRLNETVQNTYECVSCNSAINPNDKFCGSCGTPVVIPPKEEESFKLCSTCEENIPSSAAYCPCCGNATNEL